MKKKNLWQGSGFEQAVYVAGIINTSCLLPAVLVSADQGETKLSALSQRNQSVSTTLISRSVEIFLPANISGLDA